MNDQVTRTAQGVAELEAAVDRVRGERWFETFGFTPTPMPFRVFYRRIIDFDPLPVLQTVSVPSLWLFGGRDAEMPSAESAAILEELKAQGKDITIRVFPSADHTLFVWPGDVQPFRWMGFVPGYVDAMTE